MRVQLIAPSRPDVLRTGTRVSLAPPLNLALLASLTPPEIEVSLTDENFAPIDFSARADLVGITSTTQTATRAYEIADGFRARGVAVVLGGMHPSVLPEEAAQHADAVVVGEAERVWHRLLTDLQDGRLQPMYRGERLPALTGLPNPRRDLFPHDSYVFQNSLQTTRGCPFACSFCAVTSFFGRTYRSRPLGEVLAEIDSLTHRQLLFFVDDNIVAHPGRAKQLFRALIPYKISWIGQASVTIANDEELLSLAAASGCLALFVGIESLSPASLVSVGKKCNVTEEYEEVIRRIHAHKIAVFAGFIFGMDYDTEDVFESTVRFAQRTRIEGAQFNVLTPFPGTPLFEAMDKEGRILTRDWSEYHADNVVFAPRLLSARQLQEGRDWAWREFYSLRSIWQRIGVSHPRGPLAWALNLNYRDDFLSRPLFDFLLARAQRALRE